VCVVSKCVIGQLHPSTSQVPSVEKVLIKPCRFLWSRVGLCSPFHALETIHFSVYTLNHTLLLLLGCDVYDFHVSLQGGQ